MKTVEKIRRRHVERRPKPQDKRRIYRAGRESKAYALPTTTKGANR